LKTRTILQESYKLSYKFSSFTDTI